MDKNVNNEIKGELKAPFPWFGGKSRAAPLIWERLGKIDNYVEPFAGSLAVLLASPRIARTETVNDIDGFIANFWRAVTHNPDEVAHYADWPVNEIDLTARHVWLINRRAELTDRLEASPDYYDTKIAGWWCWGLCCWIGSGWCSGKGPWGLNDDGTKLVHLGNAGKGVNRQLVHLGDAGMGVNRRNEGTYEWFRTLSNRLRNVRVCCGDWLRVLGPSPTNRLGLTGIVLDPPYLDTERDSDIYSCDDSTVSNQVREWAIEHGNDPLMRIVLCGYEGEHVMPEDWSVVKWSAHGGYGSQGNGQGKENKHRERLWFSPHCESGKQRTLFDL